MIKVKPYNGGFGITNGKRWFRYYYSTSSDAQVIIGRLKRDGTVRIALGYPEPLQKA